MGLTYSSVSATASANYASLTFTVAGSLDFACALFMCIPSGSITFTISWPGPGKTATTANSATADNDHGDSQVEKPGISLSISLMFTVAPPSQGNTGFDLT